LTVLEIGSKSGGSAVWFADLLQKLGVDGHVHSFDLFPVTDLEHCGVSFHFGDGRRLAEVADAAFMGACQRPLVVVEDADHTYATTRAVLDFCDQWLKPGEYVVVEDGNLSDLYPQSYPDHSSGPHQAIREFLAEHDSDYDIDADLCDFFGYNATSCTNGFIRKLDPSVPAVGAAGSGGPDPAALLRSRPWASVRPPGEVLDIPTMLSEREQGLLYWLARDYISGHGRIVDAGCFLGGSTGALAAGLRDRRSAVPGGLLVSYDLFRVEQYTLETFGDRFPNREVGASFRPAFDRTTGIFGEVDVEVREGDICAIGWSGEPIELLFLDIVKTHEVNDVVLAQFFPRLIPGRSVLIQQDYHWGYAPWIHITMELFADYVEILDWMPNGTVAYLLTDGPPPDLYQTRVRDLSRQRQVELMDLAVARWEGDERGMVELARVVLIAELDGPTAALQEFRAVEGRYPGRLRVEYCAAVLAGIMGW
jgi:hypothetical protein